MVKITDNGKSDIHDEKGTHKVNILLWKKQQHKNNWAHKKSRSLMQIFILSNTYIYIPVILLTKPKQYTSWRGGIKM